jgi:hypothetical protein
LLDDRRMLPGMDAPLVTDASGIERVAEDLMDVPAREGAASGFLSRHGPGAGAAAPPPEFGMDEPDGAELAVEREDLPHDCGLVRARLQRPALGIVAEGHDAAHPEPLALGGGDLVADALGRDLALELGEAQEHVQRQPPTSRAVACEVWPCRPVGGERRILSETSAPSRWRP